MLYIYIYILDLFLHMHVRVVYISNKTLLESDIQIMLEY